MLSKNITHALTSLNRGYSKGLGKAPHKPVLLLAVLHLFEKGKYTSNYIPIDLELIGEFRGVWNLLVTSGHTPNFALPFFHLKNESSGIWSLNLKSGFEKAITASRSIKSLNALEEFCNHASLREDIFIAACEPMQREAMKQLLMQTYFNAKPYELDHVQNYAAEIASKALQETPEAYMSLFKAEDKFEIEEESYIRSATFKKVVPQIYDNTCAVTGLQIVSKTNYSLLDACHVVPFAETHNDHPSNGIALTPTFHRAFDRGFISIDDNYRLLVSDSFTENNSTASIHQYRGKEIKLPNNPKLYPNPEGLKWHRERFGF